MAPYLAQQKAAFEQDPYRQSQTQTGTVTGLLEATHDRVPTMVGSQSGDWQKMLETQTSAFQAITDRLTGGNEETPQ